MKDAINFQFENDSFVISIDYRLLLALITIVIGIILIIRIPLAINNKSSILKKEKFELKVGPVSTSFSCDYSDREIAFKIWIEMITRKIGLKLDFDNDTIVQVYDSWYIFFTTTRETIKTLPGNKINSSEGLVDSLIKILNSGLRNHLTEWQAKFRKWFNEAIKDEKNKGLSPQEIQRQYPLYNELKASMEKTNAELIDLMNQLYPIAFVK